MYHEYTPVIFRCVVVGRAAPIRVARHMAVVARRFFYNATRYVLASHVRTCLVQYGVCKASASVGAPFAIVRAILRSQLEPDLRGSEHSQGEPAIHFENTNIFYWLGQNLISMSTI